MRPLVRQVTDATDPVYWSRTPSEVFRAGGSGSFFRVARGTHSKRPAPGFQQHPALWERGLTSTSPRQRHSPYTVVHRAGREYSRGAAPCEGRVSPASLACSDL